MYASDIPVLKNAAGRCRETFELTIVNKNYIQKE
jgi:hypothetical protein